MIHWTDQGLSDLQNIHRYIARDNPEAASRTVQTILRGLDTVERFPEAGRMGSRFPSTRELIVYPYLIVYRRKADAIEVVAIIHGARQGPGT
jgi:toxin ParE1/3/4